MRFHLVMAVASLTAACGRTMPAPVTLPQRPLDSLSLERGACYGICEIYQFVVRRNGVATIRRKSVESTVALQPGEAQGLLTSAADAGLSGLPPKIRGDSTLCPLEASDHSTIIVTAYAAGAARRVEHYTGCYVSHDLRVAPPLERLVILERRIDALVAARNGG
jgi:hypothetical protein